MKKIKTTLRLMHMVHVLFCFVVIWYQPANFTDITEMEMMSFWWNFHHWLHWKLSKMTTSSAASDENFIKMMTFPFQGYPSMCTLHGSGAIMPLELELSHDCPSAKHWKQKIVDLVTCRHWWHHKSPLRQLTVPPVMTKLSNSQFFFHWRIWVNNAH